MKRIYSKNGITLTINSTITISDTQYATVSGTFTNSTTSALVSQGVTAAVNLFFIEDYYPSDWSGTSWAMQQEFRVQWELQIPGTEC